MKSNLSWMGKRSLGNRCVEARITVHVHTRVGLGTDTHMLPWKKPPATKILSIYFTIEFKASWGVSLSQDLSFSKFHHFPQQPNLVSVAAEHKKIMRWEKKNLKVCHVLQAPRARKALLGSLGGFQDDDREILQLMFQFPFCPCPSRAKWRMLNEF